MQVPAMTTQRTISPVDGSVYVERTLASPVQIEAALESARLAQHAWRGVPIGERAEHRPRQIDAAAESHCGGRFNGNRHLLGLRSRSTARSAS